MVTSLKSYLRHALKVLQKDGLKALLRLVRRRLDRRAGRYYQGFFDYKYDQWRRRNLATSQGNKSPMDSPGPLISIVVPVYNVELRWLNAMVQSVLEQSYPHWQLCITNDGSEGSAISETLASLEKTDNRICISSHQCNMGIAAASNSALAMAQGECIALLDHDDLLAVDALQIVAETVVSNPLADFFYSDEDKVDTAGNFNSPFFKPDFSAELLLSQNFIGHLVVIRSDLIRRLQGFRMGYDGAQDYDLVLRATAAANQIIHIPKVLYHWRQITGSSATVYGEKSYAWSAGRHAVQDYVDSRWPDTLVETGEIPGTHRIVYSHNTRPLVSIVIPFRDKPELLDRCLSSVFSQTTWQQIEVIGLDNQSSELQTQEVKQHWLQLDSRVRFVEYDKSFNFSAICNQGVVLADGEFVVLLNNDVEITCQNWIEEMLGLARQSQIGAVGAVLHYPDQRIQHAGIVVGIGGSAGHPFKTFPGNHPGYFGRLKITSNVSAVTAAMMMVSRKKFLEAGGLDENLFGISLNDVDFCLKLLQLGYRNVVNPQCQAIHFESSSRGSDFDSIQKHRYLEEVYAFQDKWAEFLENGDPFYNPNLTLSSEDYTLR